MQVGHVCKTPIILFGELWRPLLRWMNEEVLARGLVDASDLAGVFHVGDTPQRVVDLIVRLEADRSREGASCFNFRKYRVDGTLLDEAGGEGTD